MSRVLTNEQNYYDIAATIRQMKNVNTTYKPREMASALKDIYSNEVEGTLPLSFEANGNFLLDYRIDGASGGVGDRTGNLFTNVWFQGVINASTGIMETSSIFVCSDFIPITPLITYSCSRTVSREYNNLRCYDANKQYVGTGGTNANIGNPLNNGASFGTFMITNESVAYIRFNDKSNDLTTKYMLVEGEYTASTMPDYEPYGYKVPVVVSGKNLLQNKATSRTLNGVTCTVNDDKSVTFTGSPERSFDLIFNNSLILNPGTYIYTNGLTQSYSKIRVDMYVAGTGGNINYWANPSVTFTTTNTYKFVSRIFIQGNAGDLAGLTIYPMVREASITDDTYEQYIEPTTTNIYLDNPILENESISLSDTNKNIPTIDGTNTLTINTTIQPSNVYVQAPKDSIEATMIANALEEI